MPHCTACTRHSRSAPVCSALCAHALRVVQPLHRNRQGGKVVLNDTDALNGIFRAVAHHTNIDAQAFQNSRGDIVLPARVVDGICAGIVLRHIGPNGTKRGRGEDIEDAVKEEKLEAVVKRQLFEYKQISDDVAFDISQLPRDLIWHLMTQLDYSSLLKFNASSKMAHSLVEKSGALYNFSNTRYIIGQLTHACTYHDKEQLRRGMQACSYYMPALFMLFTGALMDLTAWVQGRSSTSYTVTGNPARMIVHWLTTMWMPRLEQARHLVQVRLQSLTGLEYRRYAPVYQLNTGAIVNHDVYVESSNEFQDTWFLHSIGTVNEILLWDAFIIRNLAAGALQWLYGDPGYYDREVIGLDPDTSFLATCDFHATHGYSRFNRYGDVTFGPQTYLPSTVGVALRIMARCSSPAVTCGAYYGKYEIMPVTNVVGEVRSIRQVGPLALSYMALFCAPAAVELAAKAGCLSQLAQQVLAVAWRNPVWEIAFVNFFKAQYNDKYLRDLEMSGYLDVGNKIRSLIEKVRREWVPLTPLHEDIFDEEPGGSPAAVTHAQTLLANTSSLRVFGFTDKALAHALFAPQTVNDLLVSDPVRNPRYVILYNAMSDRFKRLVMQSPFAEYILTDTSDAHLASHLPALNEIETIRTAFWIGSISTVRDFRLGSILFKSVATLLQKACIINNYNLGLLVKTSIHFRHLADRGVFDFDMDDMRSLERLEATPAEWALSLHRYVAWVDFAARGKWADELDDITDLVGSSFSLYMQRLSLSYTVTEGYTLPDETLYDARNFDFLLLQRGLTNVSAGDPSLFYITPPSSASSAAAAAAAATSLTSASSLSVAPSSTPP